MASRRFGTAGKARSPGQQARRLGAAALVLALLAGLLGLYGRSGEAGLRDLSALQRVDADVLDVDYRRRAPDLSEIAYEVDGRTATARVPYSGPVRVGERLPVAYLPSDPARVRPVEGWSPGYERLLLSALVLLPLGVVLSALGALSRARKGRYEGEGPLDPAVDDRGLGQRVVRTRPIVPVLMVAPFLAPMVALLVVASRPGAAPGPLAVVALVLLVLMAGLLALLLWQHGRDGVWSTPTHLVARRRSALWRWPWEQVHELGIVVRKGRAAIAAARVDDGLEDGTGPGDWVRWPGHCSAR